MKARSKVLGMALAGVLMMAPALLASVPVTAIPQDLGAKVRHQLLMLPYYSVFDNLAYKVEGDTVTLYGQVTWPAVKSDAYNVVRRIPGVEKVQNDIKVLPLSPLDDQIRWAELRAIYSQPALQRYAFGPVPPIHIIVDNGHVTLVGVVDNQADKDIAGIEANGVSGVFSVTNDLRVVKS